MIVHQPISANQLMLTQFPSSMHENLLNPTSSRLSKLTFYFSFSSFFFGFVIMVVPQQDPTNIVTTVGTVQQNHSRDVCVTSVWNICVEMREYEVLDVTLLQSERLGGRGNSSGMAVAQGEGGMVYFSVFSVHCFSYVLGVPMD